MAIGLARSTTEQPAFSQFHDRERAKYFAREKLNRALSEATGVDMDGDIVVIHTPKGDVRMPLQQFLNNH